MANGQAITVRREPQATAMVQHAEPIEPTNMAELRDFAKLAAESRFFGAENAGQALMIAMAGRDLGFSYTQAMRAFYNVKGKLTLSADGMVAACMQHRDTCEWFRPVEMTDTRCTWETKRVGMAEPVRYSFSMEDAQRAGLASDMYRKHPRRMLSARAKSYLARDVYPELLMGLVSEDEAAEIATSREPAPPVQFHAEPVREFDPPERFTLIEEIDACADDAALTAMWKATAAQRKAMSATEQAALRDMFAARKIAIAAERAAAAPATEEHDAEPVEPQS